MADDNSGGSLQNANIHASRTYNIYTHNVILPLAHTHPHPHPHPHTHTHIHIPTHKYGHSWTGNLVNCTQHSGARPVSRLDAEDDETVDSHQDRCMVLLSGELFSQGKSVKF